LSHWSLCAGLCGKPRNCRARQRMSWVDSLNTLSTCRETRHRMPLFLQLSLSCAGRRHPCGSRRSQLLDPRAGYSRGPALLRTSLGSAAWSFRSGCGTTRKAPSEAAAVSIAVAGPLKPHPRGMHGRSCNWRPPSIHAGRPRGLATACDSSCRGHRARSCRSLDQLSCWADCRVS
jgi:hypothetical protein